MFRALLTIALCAVSTPVFADPMDDVAAAIYDGDMIKGDVLTIKEQFRKCSNYSDCTAVLSVCRWRPVNKISENYVSKISSKVQPECKWPPPPAEAPKVNCVSNLCQIAVDGKYY